VPGLVKTLSLARFTLNVIAWFWLRSVLRSLGFLERPITTPPEAVAGAEHRPI
jgi:hypothetical protein